MGSTMESVGLWQVTYYLHKPWTYRYLALQYPLLFFLATNSKCAYRQVTYGTLTFEHFHKLIWLHIWLICNNNYHTNYAKKFYGRDYLPKRRDLWITLSTSLVMDCTQSIRQQIYTYEAMHIRHDHCRLNQTSIGQHRKRSGHRRCSQLRGRRRIRVWLCPPCNAAVRRRRTRISSLTVRRRTCTWRRWRDVGR